MRINLLGFAERLRKEDTSLPEEVRQSIISELNRIKWELSQNPDLYHLGTDAAMNLAEPDVREFDEHHYTFSVAGLELAYPYSHYPKDTAKMDFTPFLMAENRTRLSAIAIAAFLISIEDFFSFLDHTKLPKPQKVRGNTNSVMAHFLEQNLGFKKLSEQTAKYTGAPEFTIEAKLSDARKKYAEYVGSVDFEQLIKILRKTKISSFGYKKMPRTG